MAFLLAAAVAAGVAAGAFTGILPGLHVNMAAFVAASLVSQHNPAAAAFILAMSISHAFHEFIPAVFLGYSESETALATLPGHRMLRQGHGRKAVIIAALGCASGVFALVALAPLLIAASKGVYGLAKGGIWAVLLLVMVFQLLRSRNRFAAAFILALSGTFGVAVFNLPSLREPLLPMFSGLFGLSAIISNIASRPELPKQERFTSINFNPAKAAKLLGIGLFSSALMGIFPALGPAQAAMLGTAAIRKLPAPAYMFLLGVISSASMAFALITLYAFGKARNGSIAIMGELITPDGPMLAVLLVAALAAAALSFASTAWLSLAFSAAAQKVSYRKANIIAALIILAVVAAVSGIQGLAVLLVAASIGRIPMATGTSRQLLMGCLMIPVISYYL